MTCSYYKSKNGRVQFSALGGYDIASLSIDGEEYYSPETVKANLTRAAKIANEYYDCYKGWSDYHILMEASKQYECSDCPWHTECELYAKEHE